MSKVAPELQKYYEDYMDLFALDGWKAFEEDLKDAMDAIQILALEDAKQLHIAQGKLDTLTRLSNWKLAISNTYDDLLAEGSNDEDDI
tara:strand:+ start:745 stop:1008 length:264 start_codon:yes stop_codon:yes gene_type:complete